MVGQFLRIREEPFGLRHVLARHQDARGKVEVIDRSLEDRFD